MGTRPAGTPVSALETLLKRTYANVYLPVVGTNPQCPLSEEPQTVLPKCQRVPKTCKPAAVFLGPPGQVFLEPFLGPPSRGVPRP